MSGRVLCVLAWLLTVIGFAAHAQEQNAALHRIPTAFASSGTNSCTGSATSASGSAISAKVTPASVAPPQTPSIRTASEDIGPGVHGLLAAVQPEDGCTYSWTIAGGTVDSGAGTNQISFGVGTGSSLPLQCVVTNAAGLSASGSLTLFVPTGGLDPMPATTVGGTVQGLTAGKLVLQNNQGNNLVVTSNDPFKFGVPVASGSPYSATVLSQPDAQICTLTNGSGIVGQAGVTDIAIACAQSLRYYPVEPPSASLGGAVTDSLRSPFTLGLSTEGLFEIRNALVADLDGDGYPEVILGITTYPNQIAQPIIVVGAKTSLSLLSDSMFGDGVPQTQHPNQMFTADLNGDGLPDLVIGNAGIDHPPWTGGPIAVALNIGGGKFRNVSASIPISMAETRSYSVAAGDLHKDGKVEILLSGNDTSGNSGDASETLHWNGSGFDEDPAWISKQIWAHPGGLCLARIL